MAKTAWGAPAFAACVSSCRVAVSCWLCACRRALVWHGVCSACAAGGCWCAPLACPPALRRCAAGVDVARCCRSVSGVLSCPGTVVGVKFGCLCLYAVPMCASVCVCAVLCCAGAHCLRRGRGKNEACAQRTAAVQYAQQCDGRFKLIAP